MVASVLSGGDVQALHTSATETPGGPCEYAEAFFTREYRMNYTLHTYPKPIICWGHGIVMGGGLGVMAGCSHRLVTEKTRIAMPEVTIALFPDVGGSWFLTHLVGAAKAKELYFTSPRLSATDAAALGIVNEVLPDDGFEEAALDYCHALTDRAPIAMRYMKENINRAADVDLATALDAEAINMVRSMSTA